jgi:hypothetical protein
MYSMLGFFPSAYVFKFKIVKFNSDLSVLMVGRHIIQFHNYIFVFGLTVDNVLCLSHPFSVFIAFCMNIVLHKKIL